MSFNKIYVSFRIEKELYYLKCEVHSYFCEKVYILHYEIGLRKWQVLQ